MTPAADKADHSCGICGARPAPFGFRLPGLRSALPASRRGYLWACADHRDAAEDRHARACLTIPTQDATHRPAGPA